jgi:hypothetical protein
MRRPPLSACTALLHDQLISPFLFPPAFLFGTPLALAALPCGLPFLLLPLSAVPACLRVLCLCGGCGGAVRCTVLAGLGALPAWSPGVLVQGRRKWWFPLAALARPGNVRPWRLIGPARATALRVCLAWLPACWWLALRA